MKMINEVVPKYKNKFLEFNKYEHLLDTFFSQFLLEKCYESFLKVFVLTFCLFHGQAAIEHVFKTNNDCSVTNQRKESLIALRIVKDHLNAKTVTTANIQVTRNMISIVKAARARYFEEIDQKNKAESQSKVNLKRKIVSYEITDVQKEKAHLQESINDLLKDTGKLAFEAETKNDQMSFKKLVEQKKS